MNIPGLDDLENEVQRLKKRYFEFLIFNISNLDPIEYHIKKTGGKNYNGELIINYNEKKLIETFNICRENVEQDVPCFIVYDFVFYEKGLWKTSLCLISFIPDNLNIKNKVVYSTNALNLKRLLEIPLLISVNNVDDLTYENIKDRCNKYKLN
ncbi:cofilin-like protein [Vairimorpha apis BRL 01]|uniref:Cofilin-like protein n=1 Tax=Vairimorpha apis BRL 01 TaxID=1037528 RepID=T0KXU8_9MICR|nr:cofilin-like protein [Vairimorpha apis BRL 01]